MDSDDFIPTRQSLLNRLKDWQDQESWREFFEVYWRLIYKVARKAGLTESESEEAVQDTLLAVAKKMPEFRYDPVVDSFKGCLLRVTRWKVADAFRRRHAQPESAWDRNNSADDTATAAIERIADPASLNLDDIWEEEWRANLFEAALARVKQRIRPRQFEIYYLHVIKQQPPAEVARTFGINVAQVYLARHRVGAMLKKETKALQSGRLPAL